MSTSIRNVLLSFQKILVIEPLTATYQKSYFVSSHSEDASEDKKLNPYKQGAHPRKPYARRWGYTPKIYRGGPLPRIDDGERISRMPTYKPKDSWTTEKALFGQNDYIDILGDGSIGPPHLVQVGPSWVRGIPRHWGEYEHIIRKKKMIGSFLKRYYPSKYRDLNKRLKYLYNRWNKKFQLGKF